MITDQFSIEQLSAAKIVNVERLGKGKLQFTFHVADQILIGICSVESLNGIALAHFGDDQWMHSMGEIRSVASVAVAFTRANREID